MGIPANILIIEDDKPTQRALADRFSQEGFKVSVASNGQEGLNQALESHPDLILLDIIMPTMDGISVLKKIREDGWGQTVPIIVLTNVSGSQRAAATIRQGAYDYLVKAEWKLDDVVQKAQEALRAREGNPNN